MTVRGRPVDDTRVVTRSRTHSLLVGGSPLGSLGGFLCFESRRPRPSGGSPVEVLFRLPVASSTSALGTRPSTSDPEGRVTLLDSRLPDEVPCRSL